MDSDEQREHLILGLNLHYDVFCRFRYIACHFRFGTNRLSLDIFLGQHDGVTHRCVLHGLYGLHSW